MTETTPVYLVFGAYGGVGTALANRLHSRGARLAVSGRDSQRLEAVAAATGALPVLADATDFAAVDDTVSRTLEHFGRLDGVANCVGSLLLKAAHSTRPEEWHATLTTNLTSAFAVLRSAVGPMKKQEGGSVVLVSTAAASIGLPHHEAIAAAKGGIDAMVRSAAATYGRWSIRVNAVAPGLVETPLTQRIVANEKSREASAAMHALQRLGRPDDVASAIDWLLSAESTWVTGQTVGIDGGLGRVRAA